MKKINKNTIGINISDDYYDDDFIPKGKKQKTDAYIVTLKHGFNTNLLKDYQIIDMLLVCVNKLQEIIKGTEKVEVILSKQKIKFKNLTHKRRNELVKYLNKEYLTYREFNLYFISES